MQILSILIAGLAAFATAAPAQEAVESTANIEDSLPGECSILKFIFTKACWPGEEKKYKLKMWRYEEEACGGKEMGKGVHLRRDKCKTFSESGTENMSAKYALDQKGNLGNCQIKFFEYDGCAGEAITGMVAHEQAGQCFPAPLAKSVYVGPCK